MALAETCLNYFILNKYLRKIKHKLVNFRLNSQSRKNSSKLNKKQNKPI